MRQWDRAKASPRFAVDREALSAPTLVVLDEITSAVRVAASRQRRILVLTEPPEVKRYRAGFANQFGSLISAYPVGGYRGRWIESQPGLPWFFGVDFSPPETARPPMSLEALIALEAPAEKVARISVVISAKTKVKRHRQRLALVEHLRNAFPGQIDVFGSGFRQIPDKADAILPYRYHLVLENNDVPHFWTEKLADAYLGYALPLFSGCANVTDYFAPDSLIVLPPIDDLDAVTRVVGDVLARDPYEAHAPAIRVARQRLIDEHNLFALLARTVGDLPDSLPARGRDALLRPARDFKNLANMLRMAERVGDRLLGRG